MENIFQGLRLAEIRASHSNKLSTFKLSTALRPVGVNGTTAVLVCRTGLKALLVPVLALDLQAERAKRP